MKSSVYYNIKFLTVIVLASVCAAIMLPSKVKAANDPIIPVEIGRTKIVRLNLEIGHIFIGNPAIVDGQMLDENLLILTGKSYGNTNLIILDKEGNSVFQTNIVVEPDNREKLTLFKGINEATYQCSPKCTQVLSPHDSADAFGKVSGSFGNYNRTIEQAARAAEEANKAAQQSATLALQQ